MQVLIAGAGPVGLAAANVLADAGIEVEVLEAERELPQTLRASTFQPPTLDLLARLGATEQLIAMGRIAPKLQYRDRSGWVAELDFGVLKDDTRHPFRVQCEQFRLNQVLAARLGRVRYNAAVTALEQDADGVTVTVNGAERLRAQYVIGADGGRSRVREAVGIKLEGFTWPERFLVASTPFDFPSVLPGLADVSYFADPQEWFFLLRVRDVWRVMFPTRAEESEADILSDAGIERRLQRVYAKAGRYDVTHRTLYSVHQRVAETYRRGRVFLAGDAAHLNNPLGGMGLNGGLHDVISLTDRLIASWTGKADATVLDGYEPQRRPEAINAIHAITTRNKKLLEERDPAVRARNLEDMRQTAADPARSYQYLLDSSMISSLRRSGMIR